MSQIECAIISTFVFVYAYLLNSLFWLVDLQLHAPWRGGEVFMIMDGRSWSYTKYENFRKDFIFPGDGRPWTYEGRTLGINAHSEGRDEIEFPPVSNATCK